MCVSMQGGEVYNIMHYGCHFFCPHYINSGQFCNDRRGQVSDDDKVSDAGTNIESNDARERGGGRERQNF